MSMKKIIKKFVALFRRDRETERPQAPCTKIMQNLELMNKNNPANRPEDKYDIWFKDNVEEMYKYHEALKFINTFWHIENSFFNYLHQPDKNLELQKKITTVYHSSVLRTNKILYPSLFVGFLKRWDFLPEIKNKILTDEQYASIIPLYKSLR